MARTSLTRIVKYCDRLLRTASFEDWEGAANGLQVENRGTVSRLAGAVDATAATIRMAIEARADLLVVHHGLFYNPSHPWTGKRYELLRLLLEGNVAVYSSHLPLDAHPKLGNNARLCRALKLKRPEPFLTVKGQTIGFKSATRLTRDELGRRLARVLGRVPVMLPGGPERCQVVGVVSGGAGAELRQAADDGVDTLVTGEGPYWTRNLAEELGVNVFYGGHYATETFGVKALTEHLARRFGLPWTFLDRPIDL